MNIGEINKIIDNGRRYAYGIDTLINPEKAYECWKSVKSYLSAEDRAVFESICDVVFECDLSVSDESVSPIGNSYAGFGMFSNTVKISNSFNKQDNISLSDIEGLFTYLLMCANEKGKLNSFYKALKAFEKKELNEDFGIASVAQSPKNNRFCNVFGYYVWRFFGRGNSNGVQVVLNGINEIRESKGVAPIKYQAIFNVYKGKNGMSFENKTYFVEFINKTNKWKPLLKKEDGITLEDLNLSLSDTIKLFNKEEKNIDVEEILISERV